VHFGHFSSKDIQVWKEDKKIYGIQIRLDLRNFDINLIDKIIYFSKKFKYSFFIVESKKLIPQNRDILISSIKDSSAYKFVKNPTDFFDNIS